MYDVESDFDKIKMELANSRSIRGALFVLKTRLKTFHECHVAYEYMIDGNAFIRGDLVTMTTLPKENTDKYWESGGTNSDPVIENAASIKAPLFVDLEKLCHTPKSKFYKNAFFMSLKSIGCTHLAAYPFAHSIKSGFGVLTVFANEAFVEGKMDEDYYVNIASHFHESLKKHGQVLRYFKLDEKEVETLCLTAKGKSAADIADSLNLSRRLIELRLQNGRKKLHARTTTEAVFKATVYGIIP